MQFIAINLDLQLRMQPCNCTHIMKILMNLFIGFNLISLKMISIKSGVFSAINAMAEYGTTGVKFQGNRWTFVERSLFISNKEVKGLFFFWVYFISICFIFSSSSSIECFQMDEEKPKRKKAVKKNNEKEESTKWQEFHSQNKTKTSTLKKIQQQ